MVGKGKTNKGNFDRKPQTTLRKYIHFQKIIKMYGHRLKEQIFVTAQRHLIIIRGVSLDAVSHEECVGAGGDEGMTRSHNLKAQETESTQQGC